jgi:hypothetical protein
MEVIKMKLALQKSNGVASTYFVFETVYGVHPDGPCVEVIESYSELVMKHDAPVGYCNGWMLLKG